MTFIKKLDTATPVAAFAGAALLAGLSLAPAASALPGFATTTAWGNAAFTEFGGNGIPNNPVAIGCIAFSEEDGDPAPLSPSVSDSGGGCVDTDGSVPDSPAPDTESLVTLALGASQRGSDEEKLGAPSDFVYSNAKPGTNDLNSNTGARWNFNFFIGGDIDAINRLMFVLSYDFDPIGDDSGTWALPGPLLDPLPVEASQNLAFSFLSSGVPGFITPPTIPFDPNAEGDYSFALQAFELGIEDVQGAEGSDFVYFPTGEAIVELGITVQVRDVPVPAPLALLGLGLVLIGCRYRR